MAIDLSTAGIRVGYAVETTAGTKPTAFTNLANPKSIPDMNPEPNTLDVTSLNDTEWKRYIPGLKDVGGAIGITFGASDAFHTTWKTLCESAATAKATGKSVWFVFYIPGYTESFFMTADPVMYGMPAAEVDAVLDVTVNIVPTGNFGWSTSVNPTDPASA